MEMDDNVNEYFNIIVSVIYITAEGRHNKKIGKMLT